MAYFGIFLASVAIDLLVLGLLCEVRLSTPGAISIHILSIIGVTSFFGSCESKCPRLPPDQIVTVPYLKWLEDRILFGIALPLVCAAIVMTQWQKLPVVTTYPNNTPVVKGISSIIIRGNTLYWIKVDQPPWFIEVNPEIYHDVVFTQPGHHVYFRILPGRKTYYPTRVSSFDNLDLDLADPTPASQKQTPRDTSRPMPSERPPAGRPQDEHDLDTPPWIP